MNKIETRKVTKNLCKYLLQNILMSILTAIATPHILYLYLPWGEMVKPWQRNFKIKATIQALISKSL